MIALKLQRTKSNLRASSGGFWDEGKEAAVKPVYGFHPKSIKRGRPSPAQLRWIREQSEGWDVDEDNNDEPPPSPSGKGVSLSPAMCKELNGRRGRNTSQAIRYAGSGAGIMRG